MAIFGNSQVTGKGHALLAKVLAGVCNLEFTIAQAGDGFFDGDVMELTGLVNHRLDGVITGVKEMGTFTELTCKITNQNLTAFMQFREIGIRANDPDEGSILFAYANAGDNASPMGPFNGVWLHEEQFTIRVYTANATNIVAIIETTSFATEISFDNTASGFESENVQAALDELVALFNVTTRSLQLQSTELARIARHGQQALSNVASEMGTATLTNTLQYPFNDSEVTIALAEPRSTTDYSVYIVSATANGGSDSEIGRITVFDKLLNGFKLAYTGSAASVTIRYQVQGGML